MNDIVTIDETNIENMIYEIRGKQVMLDSDLAKLYECKNGTKTLNLAVKRHINRFPDRYMFQLTEEEFDNLRFQFETSSAEHGGRRYTPYAFTEQGVAMLATVIKTPIAEEVSISIMDDFVKMRHLINDNKDVYFLGSSINNIGSKISSIIKCNDKDINNILLNKINEIIK